MNGNCDRVDWEDAVGIGNATERNTDTYDGQVEWDGTVKEIRGVRHAVKEFGRAIFGDSAGTVRETKARRTSVRRASRKGPSKIVVELWLMLLGLLAYLGFFVLTGVWLGGLMLVASLKVSIHFRILVIVLLVPTYPLALAPMVWHQMYSDKFGM